MLKVLNQLEKNIHKTQTLIIKADAIIQELEVELLDFESLELDYDCDVDIIDNKRENKDEQCMGASAIGICVCFECFFNNLMTSLLIF